VVINDLLEKGFYGFYEFMNDMMDGNGRYHSADFYNRF
jgi:hypothetical protein